MLTSLFWCRDVEVIGPYCGFLLEEVFLLPDQDATAGFSLHVADIAVAELCNICKDNAVPAEALQVAKHPFICVPVPCCLLSVGMQPMLIPLQPFGPQLCTLEVAVSRAILVSR
jgi:hypothetical protein